MKGTTDVITKSTYAMPNPASSLCGQSKRPQGNPEIKVERPNFHNLRPFPAENPLNALIYCPLISTGNDPVHFSQMM